MTELHSVTPAGCASCISRRAFLADAAALAALMAAACTDAAGPRASFGPISIKVADFPALATDNRLVFPDAFRAVKRTGAATFSAFSRSCTHEGTPVDLSGTGFVCNNHGSRFDNNGQVTVGPAPSPLPTLTTSYDPATDMLTVGGTD